MLLPAQEGVGFCEGWDVIKWGIFVAVCPEAEAEELQIISGVMGASSWIENSQSFG